MRGNKLVEAKERYGELIDEYDKLVEAAQQRSLSTDEKSREKQLNTDLRLLKDEIKALETDEKRIAKRAFDQDRSRFGLSDESDEGDERNFSFEIFKKTPVNKSKPIQDFVLRNYDVHEDLQKADVFSVMAALATGRTKDNTTKRALEHVTKSATTTVMLTEFLSSQLLDGGLSHSHLARSGMNVFTMQEGTHRFVKIDTYPTFEWKAELAQTTDRTVVFSDVQFEAKTLRGFVNCSGEQLQDAHNINKSLRQVFNRSMGNSIDTAGLFGSGTGAEPEGIVNYNSVNTWDNNGPIESYDPFIYAMKLIADENGDPESTINTSIMSPAAWRDLNLLKEGSTNAPLSRPEVLKNHRFLHTTKVPTNLGTPANRTEIVMGGFQSLNLGVRLQTEIIITPVQADKFQYSFFVVFRGDFKPTREQDFAVITNVYAPDVIT